MVCPDCRREVPWSSIDEHTATQCPRTIVTCPACKGECERADLARHNCPAKVDEVPDASGD